MTKRRASKRLANTRKKAKAEENKKKKEVSKKEAVEEEEKSKEEEEPFPLEQLGVDMMNCALEKLRVKESMTLMSTKKSMMYFYESKARFKIPFAFIMLEVEPRENGKVSIIQHNPGTYSYRHFGSKILQKRNPLRSDLQRLPFRFIFYALTIDEGITPAGGQALKERLDLLKIDLIEDVHLDSNVSSQELDIIEQSLANIVIGRIQITAADTTLMSYPFIRKNCLLSAYARGSLLEHMTLIENKKLEFQMNHVENVSKTELEAAVETVIEKWSRTPCALELWKLRLTPREDMTTYEVLKTAMDARGPIDFNSPHQIPIRRPLFFIRTQSNNERNQYYISREDNSLIHIYFDERDYLVFEVVPVVEGPPAFAL